MHHNSDTDADLAWQWVDYELSQQRSVTLTVTGQSMLPYIPSGSILTFTPFQAEKQHLQIGQVVYCPKLRIVHRVIAKYGQRIWVKGDRLAYCDPITDSYEITACVTCVKHQAIDHHHQLYLTLPTSLIPLSISYCYMMYKRCKNTLFFR